MEPVYDKIGVGYSQFRKPDPGIATAICNALGNSEKVLNVGAGTGSYEPKDRKVVAVEPSSEMIQQRPVGAAPVHQATAEDLPFEDDEFDAAMALLSIHHWNDYRAGIREMQRVSQQRIVIFTYDPEFFGFWLTDYLPEITEIDLPAFPAMEEFHALPGTVTIETVPIPHDCTDGFMCAYWRRPEAYLDANVRSAISTFSKIGNVSQGLNRLESDLKSGEWERKYSELSSLEEINLGYRLVVVEDW
ncbi:MAG: class I SAM-dependent methyltransferase [Verrucomicrobiales bacterium]|nr:class I SAM-dependent methyltransferase [Verrucomicrobiales bacterium]